MPIAQARAHLPPIDGENLILGRLLKASSGMSGRLPGVIFLPAVPERLLTEGFRRAVLGFLVRQQALSEALRSRILGWRYSGFSAHNQVRYVGGLLEPRAR